MADTDKVSSEIVQVDSAILSQVLGLLKEVLEDGSFAGQILARSKPVRLKALRRFIRSEKLCAVLANFPDDVKSSIAYAVWVRRQFGLPAR